MHPILKCIQKEAKHVNQLGVLLLTCLIGSYLLICWVKVMLQRVHILGHINVRALIDAVLYNLYIVPKTYWHLHVDQTWKNIHPMTS